MTECELCGTTKNLFLNHYEEHINPPRILNICKRCHSSLEGHGYNKSLNPKVVKSFKSGALTIPKAFVKVLEITEGDHFIVCTEGKRIVYEPLDVK